jgi:hypothetical protein
MEAARSRTQHESTHGTDANSAMLKQPSRAAGVHRIPSYISLMFFTAVCGPTTAVVGALRLISATLRPVGRQKRRFA